MDNHNRTDCVDYVSLFLDSINLWENLGDLLRCSPEAAYSTYIHLAWLELYDPLRGSRQAAKLTKDYYSRFLGVA